MSSLSIKEGWSKDQLLARSKAGALHLLASLLVAICVTLPLILWLYPSPFLEAAGGSSLLLMILGIDVVLGPLLTFLVFDRRKASLKRDLRVIIGIQLIALVYGLYVTSLSRPVFMTFVVDRFEMVSAAEVDDEEMARAPVQFRDMKWGHPIQAFAEQPTDPKERQDVLFAFVKSGIDLKQFFRYYKPFETALPLIRQRAQAVESLKKFNPVKDVDTALEPYQKSAELRFVPMQGKKRDLTVLVDAKDGRLIKVIDLRPW
jgi:hypothetical protein